MERLEWDHYLVLYRAHTKTRRSLASNRSHVQAALQYYGRMHVEDSKLKSRWVQIGRLLIALPIAFCLFGILLWSVILTAENTPVPPLFIPVILAALLFVKTKWRIPPLTPLGAKILLGVVLLPISMASIAFTFGGSKDEKEVKANPRTEKDYKNELLAGKYNRVQQEFVQLISKMGEELTNKNLVALTGKGADGKLAPEDIDNQVQNLRNEADFVLSAGSPVAKLWKARVTGVTRDGPYVVLHASYLGHQYDLYMFDEQAKELAQRLEDDDGILFSGNLGPERSLTRWGAFTSPSYLFYPTYVTNGTLEIKQSADQVAQLEERDAAARLDQTLAPAIMQSCKQHVLATLKYPASGSFSWFKSNVRKVSENEWLYTDVVKSVNDFGGKLPVRFVCEATLDGEKILTTVHQLDGE